MVYTLTMNPAIDYTVYLDELRVGEIQRACREGICFGGKGINVSRVLTVLGVENVALGFLAGFTGRAIADGLSAEGLRTDFCFLPSGMTRINVKLRHGTETDVNCTGADISAEALTGLCDKLEVLREGDVLVLAGSTPRGISKTVYADILALVSGRGILSVVDADGELLLRSLPCAPFLIKPNREELESVLGRSLKDDRSVVDGARELQRCGARNVLVSLGGDGALLLTESGEVYRMDAAAGECVNSVGAGDSMLAGFIAGYLASSGNVEYALRLGTAAGAASAFSEGLATREGIDAILRTLPDARRGV